MKKSRIVFQNFSNETSLHGFKRLWAAGSKFRWPIWALIITFGLSMSVYQINNKFNVFISNPLTVNINLVYKDEIKFPAITICNKLKIRVSFILNNPLLLDMLRVKMPHSANASITKQDIKWIKTIIRTWKSKDFFEKAGISKEHLILWCKLPNGQDCSSDDFETIITRDGFCYRLSKGLILKNAGRKNQLEMLLNLADYERIPGSSESAGIRVVVHNDDEKPMPSNGYDVMPGYQMAMVLRKRKNVQLVDCEKGNPLTYYDKYTYQACRSEHTLVDASMECGCKPYTLPNPVSTSVENSSVESLPDCSLLEHFACIEKFFQGIPINNKTIQNIDVRAQCTGECEREEFEQEMYYSIFRDSLMYKSKLRTKMNIIQVAYQQARDAESFLTFYQQSDSDYLNILQLSSAFENLIMKKKLVPPYGNLRTILFDKVHCLKNLMESFQTDNEKRKRFSTSINVTVAEEISKTVEELDKKIESFEISDVINFALQVRNIYRNTSCVNESQEICNLPILYDMLEIRDKLKEKKSQIEITINGLIHKFGVLTKEFVKLTNKMENDENKKIRRLMEYYLNHVNFCLKKTQDIYTKILTSGQPSMKSEKLYEKFLSKLNEADFTLNHICSNSGHMQLLFNVNDRRHIASQIVYLLHQLEVKNVNMIGYNKILCEFAESYGKKFLISDHSMKSLNQSLKDMESMNALLNQYLNQSTQNIFKKSDLYNLLFMSSQAFQRGINHYKSIVSSNLMELSSFFQIYIDKLEEYYSDPTRDSMQTKQIDNLEEYSLQPNDTIGNSDHLMCLKTGKQFLVEIEKNYLEAASLDLYKQSVEHLVYSSKLYVDDIKSLNTFYKENLGLVKIYYRDMGVKESIQERAYDFLSFLCKYFLLTILYLSAFIIACTGDIGGIIGLWLGGSVISVFETFDLLCFENIKTYFRFQKKNLRKLSNCKQNGSGLNNEKPAFVLDLGVPENNFVKPLSSHHTSEIPIDIIPPQLMPSNDGIEFIDIDNFANLN